LKLQQLLFFFEAAGPIVVFKLLVAFGVVFEDATVVFAFEASAAVFCSP
jgi:hypothetical protein